MADRLAIGDAGAPPPHRTRLWVMFASQAQKAVILLRGPKTHFHLIAWDMRTDTFTHGQWMKGFVRLWDLSPSGEKMIYWAHQYHPSARWKQAQNSAAAEPYDPLRAAFRNRSQREGGARQRPPRYLRQANRARWPGRPRTVMGSWTAISTPPYFSALAIWPSIGHWTGGGIFASDREIIVNELECGITPKESVKIPSRMRLRSMGEIARDSRKPTFSAWHPWMCDPEISEHISLVLMEAGAINIDWVAPRDNGDLLFACDGCVYRLKSWRDVAQEHYLTQAERLADFTGLRFTLMDAPPQAMRW